MLKRAVSIFLFVFSVITLVSCTSANDYGLAYNPDSSSKMEYIYYDDERVVYVVGGLMMVDIDGTAKMLEMALDAGEITIGEIIAAADSDADDGDIEVTDYPDGSREYHYGNFDMIVLNTHLGVRDVYFCPASMSYYDVTN